MSGPGYFASEYLTEGFAENHLTPPTLNPNKVGLPYTNASNHILRETLAAKQTVIVIKNELEQTLEDIQAGIAGSDIAALPARP